MRMAVTVGTWVQTAVIATCGIACVAAAPSPAPLPSLVTEPSPVTAPPPAAAPAPAPSPERAFAAVYRHPVQQVSRDGETYDVLFSPVAIYRVSRDTYALISSGRNRHTAHVDSGFYSVAYVRGGKRLQPVGDILVGSGSRGGYGEPPTFQMNNSLSHSPTLVVFSDHYGTGEGVSGVELVRLSEGGPEVVADWVPTSYQWEYYTPYTDRPDVCRVTGVLQTRGKDRQFVMSYAGAVTNKVTWSWDGSRWRSSDPEIDFYRKCLTPE